MVFPSHLLIFRIPSYTYKGIHFGDYAYSSVLGSAENKHPFMYVMAKKGVLNHGIYTHYIHLVTVANVCLAEVVSKNQDKLVTPNDMYRTLSELMGHVQKFDPRDIGIHIECRRESELSNMLFIFTLTEQDIFSEYVPEARTCDMAG